VWRAIVGGVRSVRNGKAKPVSNILHISASFR